MADPIKFRFDGKNPEARAFAEKYAARQVKGIAAETRKAIRSVITKAVGGEDDLTPLQAADRIREVIGLNTVQAQSARAYRRELKASGLPESRIEKIMEQRLDEELSRRAETIARTEIMDAVNEGALEAADQAIDEGFLSKDAVKEWIATADELTCPTCGELDGEQKPLDDDFDTDGGPVDAPPAHPNCRCTIAITAE